MLPDLSAVKIALGDRRDIVRIGNLRQAPDYDSTRPYEVSDFRLAPAKPNYSQEPLNRFTESVLKDIYGEPCSLDFDSRFRSFENGMTLGQLRFRESIGKIRKRVVFEATYQESDSTKKVELPVEVSDIARHIILRFYPSEQIARRLLQDDEKVFRDGSNISGESNDPVFGRRLEVSKYPEEQARGRFQHENTPLSGFVSTEFMQQFCPGWDGLKRRGMTE